MHDTITTAGKVGLEPGRGVLDLGVGVAELGAAGKIGLDDDVIAPVVAGDLRRAGLEVDIGDAA